MARIVDPDSYQLFDWYDWSKIKPKMDEPGIQAVDQRYRAPEIVALSDFDRFPKAAVTFNRRNIFKRDRFTCQYCGKKPTANELTIDHVLPRSRGGTSSWDNCVLACVRCNHRKANRLPAEAGMKLKKLPIRPSWSPAFSRLNWGMESWQKFISDAYWGIELRQS